jgi:hypothetical protein
MSLHVSLNFWFLRVFLNNCIKTSTSERFIVDQKVFERFVKNGMRFSKGVWQGVANGHGLPEVSPEPAMLYPSMSCRRANPETALRPACTAGGLGSSSTSLDTIGLLLHTPMHFLSIAS